MSVKAQIDVVKGNETVRIFSGWGDPENIMPALRAAAGAGHSTALDIAREIIEQVPDASFGLRIIEEDYDPDWLSYRYTVDVATTPWNGTQTRMPCIKLKDNGNGGLTFDKRLPAVTRKFRVHTYDQIRALGKRGATVN